MQRMQTRHAPAVPPNIKFVGMVREMSKSFFDLLDQEVEYDFEQESSNKNHPSQECHMVQITPVGIGDNTMPGAPPPVNK